MDMRIIRLSAVILMVGGLAGLAYGSFSYTRETSKAKIGDLELTMNERKTIDVPTWAGIAAIVLGASFLIIGRPV
jgi:TRAP-type C4-dicarboxylate transport system permease small subunit